MARFRRKAKRMFGKAKRYAKRAGVGGSKKLIQVDAMIYGALRPKIAGLITPLTANLPFGSFADNLGMGLLSYFIAKRGGMLGSIGTKGLVIENALIGGEVSQKFFGSGSNSATQDNLFIGGY